MRIEDEQPVPLSPEVIQEDIPFELNLRPRFLDEFVG